MCCPRDCAPSGTTASAIQPPKPTACASSFTPEELWISAAPHQPCPTHCTDRSCPACPKCGHPTQLFFALGPCNPRAWPASPSIPETFNLLLGRMNSLRSEKSSSQVAPLLLGAAPQRLPSTTLPSRQKRSVDRLSPPRSDPGDRQRPGRSRSRSTSWLTPPSPADHAPKHKRHTGH